MSYSLRALKQTVRQILRAGRPDPRLVTLASLAAAFILTLLVDLIHGAAVQDPSALFDRVKELWQMMDAGQIGFQRMVEELLTLAGPFGRLVWDAVRFALISSAVTWTVFYGYDGYCLDLVRGKRPGFLKLLCAFPKWGWVLLRGFLIQLFLVMWVVLFSFMGTAATAGLLLFGPGGKLESFLIVLVWALLAVWLVSIALGYSMSAFILLDDKVDALEALSRSKSMMRGRKRHLLVLLLSFLGWIAPVCVLALLVSRLLGGQAQPADLLAGGVSAADMVTRLVTLPILAWALPYLNGALAKFYDTMRHTDIAYGEWEGRITPVKKPRPKEAPRKDGEAPAEREGAAAASDPSGEE